VQPICLFIFFFDECAAQFFDHSLSRAINGPLGH